MSDHQLMKLVSTTSQSLQIHLNAHRETRTTVARHLLHRERLGDVIIFASTVSRVQCMESDTLWEISIRHSDDVQTHIAGTSLEECMELMLAAVITSGITAKAA